LIGRLVRLAVNAVAIAWFLDAVLARRARGVPAPPIRSTIRIDAPTDTVWNVLADVPRQPEWMTDLKAVRLLTPPPVGVGTRAEGDVRILGITVTDPITITEFDPPHRFAIRHEGTFTGDGVIELETAADGDGTVVTWDERLVAPVLPHLAARLQRPVFARVFQGDLEHLRELVER
jgi:uncharacterized membrane protein